MDDLIFIPIIAVLFCVLIYVVSEIKQEHDEEIDRLQNIIKEKDDLIYKLINSKY